MIALLAFILGIWLWDHYFGKNEGYPPGTEGIALVKIDRDLRLADAMEDDAAWLRWLAGVDRAEAVRLGALEVLAKLAAERAILRDPPGGAGKCGDSRRRRRAEF